MTLEELINWYLKLQEVQSKKSFKRDVQLLTSVQRLIGGQILIKDLNIGIMDGYATRRVKEDSPTKKKEKKFLLVCHSTKIPVLRPCTPEDLEASLRTSDVLGSFA